MAAALEIDGISKSYPGVRALDKVSLSCEAGEVLAVIGENGAGKSTLMRILAGIEQPDSGSIRLDGRPVSIAHVRRAQQLGIALIHQELNLADNLTIAANIFLGREPRTGWFFRQRQTETAAAAVLRQVGLARPPSTLVRTLSLGQQQLVEIARALSADARILIMDEPTSSLSSHEAEALFQVVRDVRARGVSILYISHRLGEVAKLADRVIALRDGRNAGELTRGEIQHDRMVQLMVGRDFALPTGRPSHHGSRRSPALIVAGLRTAAFPGHPVDLELCPGEIVGIAGLVGAGRTELLEAVFGIVPRRGGVVSVTRSPTSESDSSVVEHIHAPRDAIRAGVALVPEDRKLQGVILRMTVRENLSLATLRRDGRFGFIDTVRERATAAAMMRRLRVRAPTDGQLVQHLSGGTQQKIVLGKWLALGPRILLLDEPTRGIDVGSKQEIYSLIEQLAAEGVAILFVSSEMEEILRLSQRVIVMHQGKVTADLRADELSEERVMRLATGKQ